MIIIGKFEIPIGDSTWVEMARRTSKPHHLAIIQGRLYCWALTDTDDPVIRERMFYVRGTGMPIPGDGEFIGTAIDNDAGLVWHVWMYNASI